MIESTMEQSRNEFLKVNTSRISSEPTYTTSGKMRKFSIPKLVERTRIAIEREKSHGRTVIAKLGLN